MKMTTIAHRPLPRRATALATAAAAAALLLARPSPAQAQNDLLVDVAYGNSPYTFTYGYGKNNIIVGDTGVGVLYQSAYSVGASVATYIGNDAGSNGTYNLSGTGELDSRNEYIGYSGSGTFNQTGGTHYVTFYLKLGLNSGSSGRYSLSGTGALSAQIEYIGLAAGTTGIFTQSGGTNTVGMDLDIGGGTSGSYTLSAGALSVGGDENIGSSGPATFTQSGGTNTVGDFLTLAGTSSANATYNLNGGTLTASRVAGGGSGTATFNFNGGTLQAAAGTYYYYNFFQGLSVANVRAGGARIDSNSNNLTVAQGLLHDTTAGAPATDGGLTKLGAGSLLLTGANTYTGPTVVNAGTLQAGVASVAGTSGAFGINSAVTLANVSGATLDLNGYATQIGSLSGGGSTGGNVTLGSATLTVGGDNTSPAAFAGVISGGGGLVKTGTGTLTLSGNNSYAGTTSVNGGTLLVNGTHSGTGLVTVQNSGSVLGGTGTLAAAVSVTTGTLNPGNNAGAAGSAANSGRLTVGALTLSSMATSVFDIASGTTYDQLFANGNIALGGSTLTLNVTSSKTAYTIGQTLDLFHNNSGTLSGTFGNFADGGLYSYGVDTFRANYTTTDFTLTVTAVPEPTTWLGGALLLGVAALTLRRRARFPATAAEMAMATTR